MPPADPIRHVVVLMLENHSFDQMLGWLKDGPNPDVEGVDPANPASNADVNGVPYPQAPVATATVSPDPKHETPDVLRQLEGGNGGFVRDYSGQYPETTPDQRRQIMAYFPGGALPALHELARHFTVCDHWFSSVPGPTWANRFFVHSGTSKGRVRMPGGLWDDLHDPGLFLHYDQVTVYDRLNERGIPWRVYHGDVPQSLVLAHQRSARNARNYHRMSVFFADAAGPEGRFPAYAFVEPSYFWPGQNDDHPPHSAPKAQELLAQVYNALRANGALWRSTLLAVLYDEHGGFFDHVPPPAAVPPDGHAEEYAFDRLGVRVPALLVSPWVGRGVASTVFDHTSLLKYLTDKWGLAPLAERVAQANSLGGVLQPAGGPREDTPPTVPGAQPHLYAAAGAERDEPLNENQRALVAFAEQLEEEVGEPSGKTARALAGAAGPQGRVAVAKERVELFLAQRKAEAGHLS